MEDKNFFSVSKYIVCVLLVLAASCARLPDREEILEESARAVETPQVKDAEGQVSKPEVEEKIEQAAEGESYKEHLERFIKAEQAVTGSPLTTGNQVTLLVDGSEAYNSMFEAIRNAKDHIHLETFTLADDEIGRKFADLLLEKSAEDVEVRVIYDGVGSFSSSGEYFARLRGGGIKVHEFHPVSPAGVIQFWRVTHRTHRKLLIVDGKVGFTGGINISGVYSSSPSVFFESEDDKKKRNWRDTQVRIEGPAVAELQKIFLEIWTEKEEDSEELLQDKRYFPELKEAGEQLVRIVASEGKEGEYSIYKAYIAAMSLARERIWVTQAYFAPNDQFIETFIDAAERGVDVRIILQGLTDQNMVLYASQFHYDDLLETGVKLYERTDRIQHAKTAVIDGLWSTVGSSNMDYLSFVHNNEANAVILGRDFGEQMEGLFQKDLGEVKQIKLEVWEKRPLWERAMERFSSLFIYWF